MEGNKAEILKKLMEMKKEFARKQKKLEKSKRTALVKAHVRQKIKEHEDLEKQQTSYRAVDAKEICSAAQAACAGNVACVTKSPAGVEHKDYGSVQSTKMSTERCLAPSVPSFSHQSVSNFREGFSVNGALSDEHLPFSECQKYNKGKNSCEGFEVTNQIQSLQVLEFDENQQKQSTDLSDGSRETKTAKSEAAEEECILSKRLYTRKEHREDKSPIKQSFTIKSQEPQSSQHNKKNDTQDTGAMSPEKVAPKVTSTYTNSMSSEKRESETRGSKKLSSWMDFDDFKEAVVTPLRPLQCASSRSEKVSVKQCDQDGWLSAVKHKSKSVPYKRKGKYAKLKGNPKSQTAKKTLHTEMSRNEMSKYKEAKNIEKVSKDDVPVPKAISTHVYKGITSPCQLDMNTDKLVNDQEIPDSDVRNKNVTEDVDTISMTIFGRKDDLTCCPKQNGKELGVTASNHVNAETKDFFQSNNVCSDSVTKQPGMPFVKKNEATIKDEEKIHNKPQVIGSISSNESDEEIVKASQVSTGRRISGVIAGGRKGLITRTQSSSLSTLSLTPSSTLASDCQEQENVGKEETVTDSQFFNILGVSQNDEGSTYKNCADDVSQGSHLSQFVFSAQKLQSDKVSSSEAEMVQGDDSCQQSVKYDSVIVMDSETGCVPEDCPESLVASKVTRKSTCGEQISQDDFSEYTELDAIPYSQFELTEDFLSEEPCQPSSQTNMNINQKFRIKKAGALVKRRSPRTYFHDKGSPRTVGSSHSKPDYDIRKTIMTKHGFKSHPKRSLNQQRKAAAVMSVFQFLVDEAKKPDAGRDFELPSSFEKLKRERLADLNMKPQNSPVHSDTYLENQASKEDSISITKESEPSTVVSELDNREIVVQSHHSTNSKEDNQGLAGVAVQSYVTTICDTQMSEDFVTDGCTLTGTDEEIEEPIAQETTKPSSQAGESECRQGKDNAEKVTAVNIIPDSELDVEESIIKSPLPAHEKNQKTLFKSADNITPVSHKRKIRHFSKLGRRLFHTSLGVGMGASKGGNKQSEAGHDCNEGAEVVQDRLLYATATTGEIELSEPSDDFSERHRMSQNKDSSEGSVTKCLSISSKYIRAASPAATNVATANPSMSTPTYSKHQILTTVGETPNLFESSQNHLSEHEIVPKAVHDAHHLHTMSPEISSSQKPTKVCDRNPLHIVINGENSLHRTSALQSPETPVFGTPSPVSSSQASRGGFSFTSTPKTVDTCKADRVISRLDFASPLSRDKSPEDSLIVARSADVNDTTSVSGEMHLSLNINNSPSLVSKSASINAVENHHGDHSSVSNNLSQMLQSEESYVSPAQMPRELSIGNSPLQEILGAEPDDSLFEDKSAMSVISNRVDNSSHGNVRELDGLSGTPLIKPWKKLSKTATTPVQVLEEKQDHSPLGSFLFTPNKRRSRSKSSSQVENKGCPSNNFKFSGCFQSCSQDAVVSLLNGEVKTDSGSKRYLVSVQATSLTIWTEDEVCGWTTELDWRLSRDVHAMKACLLPREDVIMVIASGWERKRYFVSTFVYDINTEDTFRFNISLAEEYKELRSPTDVDLYPHTASELQLGVTTETHHTVGTVLFSDTLKAVQASSTCGLHRGKLVNLVGIKGQATASVSLTADQRITICVSFLDACFTHTMSQLTHPNHLSAVSLRNMEIRIAIRKIKLESSLPCLTGLLAATAVKGLLLVESLWRIDSSEWGGVLAVNPVNGQVQVAKKYQVPNNTWRRVESAKKESSVVTVVSDRGSFGVWDSSKGTMLGYNKSNITTSACLMKSSRDLIVGEIHGCLHIYSAS